MQIVFTFYHQGFVAFFKNVSYKFNDTSLNELTKNSCSKFY